MTDEPKAYQGKPKIVARIGGYYYSVASIDSLFYICIQKVGDINWLIKEEEFFTFEATKSQIKAIEKEHYDAIKFEAGGY